MKHFSRMLSLSKEYGRESLFVLGLSHGFKICVRNIGFTGVFSSFSERLLICVIDRKY